MDMLHENDNWLSHVRQEVTDMCHNRALICILYKLLQYKFELRCRFIISTDYVSKVFSHSLAPHFLLIFFLDHKNTYTKYKWEWTCVSITVICIYTFRQRNRTPYLNKNPNPLRQLGCVIWGNIILWKCLSAVCKK